MSMKILTIQQIITLFLVYFLMTVVLPGAVFHKRVGRHRFCVRIMIYFILGNFYIIHLVYLLQLLRISNRYTLWIFTLFPAAVLGFCFNHLSIKKMILFCHQYINRVIRGSMGIKTCLRRLGRFIGWIKDKLMFWIKERVRGHGVEILCLLLLFGYVCWIYGTNTLTTYGYCSTDIPVHNYWVNGLSDNHIFVAGVYPFGFHCIVYYFQTLFGIDVYIIFRLFAFVQTVFIHLMLFLFLKGITKTSFALYFGMAIYVCIGIFEPNCTARLFSPLPQEHGMLFILPSIYFAFLFFRDRKREMNLEEPDKKKERKKIRLFKPKEGLILFLEERSSSHWDLILFAMGFSLSLTTHFYDTLIAGLFCLAIALAFYKQFFHRKYFFSVMKAFFLSIFIALLPLGVALAMGTPPEPSLDWGIGVIKGEKKEGRVEEQVIIDTLPEGSGEVEEDFFPPDESPPSPEGNSEDENKVGSWIERIWQTRRRIFQRLGALIQKVYQSLNYMLHTAVFKNKSLDFVLIFLLQFIWMLSWAFLAFRKNKGDYGRILIAVVIYISLLLLLLSSGLLGLPVLLDSNRTRVFLVYSLPILWTFMAEAPLYILFHGLGRRKLYWISFLSCGVLILLLMIFFPLRKPPYIKGMETNQAITCLTNIIRENKNDTWTIVSANDETQMVKGRGYHYETIDFLRRMETTGHRGVLYIPTPNVYFFIEKIPIDYPLPYEKSGQSISEEGAQKRLPEGGGLAIYQDENRWIVMSKLYYWAQAYKELYPNEMTVYYEDDEFICYQMRQNPYSLNNFAIDYGFNQVIK